MAFHDRRVNVALVLGAVAADGAVVRVALEAVFGHEATRLLLVHLKRLLTPPHAPVVAVAMGDAFGMTPTEKRRGGDIRAMQRVVLLHGLGQDAVGTEKGVDTVLQRGNLFGVPLVLCLPAPVFPAILHLVVAAPQHHAGMLGNAAHLLLGFGLHVVEESAVGGIEGTAEIEILPHHDAKRIAKVVEVVRLVDAAAPDTQHVEVGFLGRNEQVAVAGTVGTVEHGERVDGNPVGSLHKDGLAIAVEGETLADGVLFLPQGDIPGAGFWQRGLDLVAVVALQSCPAEDAHGAQLGAPVPPQHVGGHAGHGAVVGQVVVHIGLRAPITCRSFVGKMDFIVLLYGVEGNLNDNILIGVGQDATVNK